MSTRVAGPQGPTIESREELVAYLEAGSTPMRDWRVGTEHEKFSFYQRGHKPVPYAGERGIAALLQRLKDRFSWDGVLEQGNIIALRRADCPKGGIISLEPGGQLELSGAPLATLHETREELRQHLMEVKEIGGELGIGFLGLGFSPKWTLAETPVMPKARYQIMQRYMPTRGRLGLDMMFRTSTVQVNLDFSGESDMVAKMRVGLALQPIATALFANSPFTEGKPNGFKTYRAEIWRDTDADRTGTLPFAFDPGMGFERYVDYALDVPMYFVYRNGRYIDAAGASFRNFLEGRLDQLPGEYPTFDDWADHLTTLFPDVRLKRFLELRGADAGSSIEALVALPAFWTGLLYEPDALAEAVAFVMGWTVSEIQTLRDQVPRLGLSTPFRKQTAGDIARTAVAIADKGLKRRAALGHDGDDERKHLAWLADTAAGSRSPADRLLAGYTGEWRGDIDRLFETYAF
jgi:glutamate--cysteine ligase